MTTPSIQDQMQQDWQKKQQEQDASQSVSTPYTQNDASANGATWQDAQKASSTDAPMSTTGQYDGPGATPTPVLAQQKDPLAAAAPFYSAYDQQAQALQLQPETFDEFQARAKQAFTEKPDPNTQVIPDAQWDYKTAKTDKQGSPLPYGATGFDPYGRAYYGEGLQGWINGAWSRITDPGAKAANFDFTKENTDIGTTVSHIASNVEAASNLTDGFGGDSPLTPILRTVKEAVNGGLQLMTVPAAMFERVVGTVGELAQDSLNLYGDQHLKANNLEEAWQASAITYSTVLDASRRDQFLEGLRAGKNPEFLAMELENPMAELAGQFVFDPMWILGGATKAGQAEKALTTTYAKATRTGVMISEDATKIVAELAGHVGNDVEAATKLETLSGNLTSAIEATKSGMQSYKPGLMSRVVSAQRALTHDITSRHVDWLINTMRSLGRSPDEIGSMLYHTALLASENEGERAVGLAAILGKDISHAHPVPAMALSDEGLQAASTLYNSIGGNADKFMEGLAEAQKTGAEGLVQFASERLASATKDMYPTVSEMRTAADLVEKGGAISARDAQLAKQYDQLSYGAKLADKLTAAKIPGTNFSPLETYKKIQGSMIAVYLSAPGTAFRNLYSNLFHGFVDQGEKFVVGRGGKLFQPFGGQAAEDLAKWAGQKIEIKGFGASGSAAEGAIGITGLVPAFNDKIESGVGTMVMRASIQDSMEKMLQPGKFLPDVQPLLDAGHSPEQATMLMRYILDAQGDVDKAIMRFRGTAAATGQVQAWQDTSRLITPKMRDFLGKLGIHGKIIDSVAGKYSSADEAVKAITGYIRETVQHHADGVIDDVVDIDKKAASYTTAQNIAATVHDGYTTAEEATQFTAMLQSGHTLENYLDQAGHMLAALAPGSAQNGKTISDIFDQFPKITDQIAAKTQGLTDKAWELTNLAKKGKIEDIGAAWAQHLLGVPVPTNLTAQQFIDALWKNRRATVSELWQSHYETLKQRTDKLFEAFAPQITDPESIAQVQALQQKSNSLFDHYDQISQAVHDGKNLMVDPLKGLAGKDYVIGLANRFGFSTATESGVDTAKSLLNTINKHSAAPFAKIEDVTPEAAQSALEAWAKETGRDVPELADKVAPAYVAGSTPSQARVAQLSQAKLEPELQQMEQFVRQNWGETMGSFGSKSDGALAAYAEKAKISIAEARNVAIKVAHEARDFTLLPYATGKTGMDAALSYIYPLGFWPTRTYANWGKRIFTDPAILGSYAKYRNTMEKIHADMPEFYRNNVNPAELLGIKTDNPVFLNLEATLWPLNGMTGVDFNDPYRRVDWWTSTLDDLGKLGGGGVSTNLSALTAVGLYMRGEKEAASRWAGRLFPQTAQIKAALSLRNIKLPDTPFTHGNELDPFVNFFSGGDDPYERRRYGTALQAMEDDGKITHEQAIDAAERQTGPIWEQAKHDATTARALPTLASWGLGVGWKGRTATDLKIEQFYGEYTAMNAKINGGGMSADATRQAFDNLRKKYPFSDLVILSKKDGFDRDRAYAYSALSRLPPGSASQIVSAAGISDALVQKFYDDKGRMTGWAESDRMKFMGAMNDIAAVFAIPDNATADDWSKAKGMNKSLGLAIQAKFGADITDKMDAFFAIGNETQRQRDQQNAYLKTHPEVTQAMDMRSAAVAQIPELNSYYGGISAVEKFYSGQMYADLKSKLGDDIFDKFTQYGDLKLSDPNGAKAFYRANPQLAEYSKLKDAWQYKINLQVASVANMLRPGAPAQLRPDIQQSTGTQAIQATYQQQNAPQTTWSEFTQSMPEPLTRIVLDYFHNGHDIPKSANYNLQRMATDYGYKDVNELLQAMGASLQQAQP